jgi:hypothetical protein
MSSKEAIAARIDDIFVTCTGSTGTADLKSVVKVFWPVLDNKVSIVDLAGVFTMCVPGNGNDTLDLITFADFFNGIARVKFSSAADYLEKMLSEVAACSGIKIKTDLPLFNQVLDKVVIRALLKQDMALRKSFSSFAGQNINVGGGLTWEEVQKLGVGACSPPLPSPASLVLRVPPTPFSPPAPPSPTSNRHGGVGVYVVLWGPLPHPQYSFLTQMRISRPRCAIPVPSNCLRQQS